MWDATKAIFRGKVIVLNVYIRKEKMPKSVTYNSSKKFRKQ